MEMNRGFRVGQGSLFRSSRKIPSWQAGESNIPLKAYERSEYVICNQQDKKARVVALLRIRNWLERAEAGVGRSRSWLGWWLILGWPQKNSVAVDTGSAKAVGTRRCRRGVRNEAGMSFRINKIRHEGSYRGLEGRW